MSRVGTKTKRVVLILWCALWAVFIGLAVYPVGFGVLRVVVVAVLLLLWAGALWLFWRRRSVRYPLIGLAVVLALALLLPARGADPTALRAAYLNSLRRFEGAPYVWGGENAIGIDCSGLVRQGLIRANLAQGVRSLDGGLLRESLALWWHDCTAAALHDEYRGKTRLLFEAPSINELDHARILPGDIAVTNEGLHTLAYIGDEVWIEADPGLGRVVIVRVPSSDVPCFAAPARIMRWRQLDGAAP